MWLKSVGAVSIRATCSRIFKMQALVSCMVLYIVAACLVTTMTVPVAAQSQEELTAEQRNQMLAERNELWKAALRLLKEGKPDEARPLFEQVLDIERRVQLKQYR